MHDDVRSALAIARHMAAEADVIANGQPRFRTPVNRAVACFLARTHYLLAAVSDPEAAVATVGRDRGPFP